MPTKTVKAKTTQYNATFWQQKRRFLRWELVGMRPTMDLDDLVLTWSGGGRPLEVSGAIKSLRVTRTIEGASMIEMVILDPNGHLFNEKASRTVTRPITTKLKKTNALTDERGKPLSAPELSGRAVEIILDDVPFRLTRVDGGLDDVYTLTFEDRIVYWLRRKRGALSASRADVTRAEFILKLIREIKLESIPFICPALGKRQPQAKPDVTEESLSFSIMSVMAVDPPLPSVFDKESRTRMKPKDTDTKEPTSKKGLESATGLTVQGKPATHEQKRNMNEVIEQASGEDGATKRSVLAVICGVIVETLVKNLEHGDSTSTGILQLLASTAAAYHVDPMDIAGVVHLFMTKGFWGKGGAIELAKKNPHMSIGMIAQNVQGSAHPERYDKWVDEAKRWLEAYSGGETSLGEGGSYRKSFQYKRDKDEDSWECGLRLADEVQWRLFPVGRAMMYSSEVDLFRRKVAETVTKGDPRVLSFPWGFDWNKSTNECTITVILDSWSAYPGTVIMIDGYGAPDGRWLVTEMERDWFKNEAELTIKQPLTPLKEPAAEVGDKATGVSGEGSKGDIGNLYKICAHISVATPGYLYGGGHGPPLSQMNATDPLDCSSSCSLALWRADLWDKDLPQTAIVSGDFSKWGSPGEGHLFTVMYNTTHVWIQFEEAAGMMFKRFDTSPHGDSAGSGPKMRKTARTDQDRFQKRHWPGM